MTEWKPWTAGELIAYDDFPGAHLDSWEKSTHPWTLSLQAYLDEREKALGPLPDNKPLYLHLDVDVHDAHKLLQQHDLDNYLIPLVKRFGHRRFVYVSGSKRVGGGCRLSVGTAMLRTDVPGSGTWSSFEHRIASIGDGKQWRQAFRAAMLSQMSGPLPPGPVEVQLAWRCSPRRTWMNLWKPTGDALGPILGEHPTANHQFNPDDGRIVHLQLYVNFDNTLGNAVDIGVWWQPASVVDPVSLVS